MDNTKLTVILLSVVIFGASKNAVANNDLVSVCGKSGFSAKNQVTIDKSTRVSLLQGGMLRISAVGGAATEELLKAEMANIGISRDCTEYLVSQGEVSELDGRIYFDFDRSSLTPASIMVMDALLDNIKQSKSRIVLEGHTDSIGSHEYNFSLAMKRAMSAQDFLVSNNVDGQTIEAISFGETQPIATNETAEGRQLNRRVDIKSY